MAEQKTAEQAPAEQPQGSTKPAAKAKAKAEQKFPVKLKRERDGQQRVAHDARDLVRFQFDGFKA